MFYCGSTTKTTQYPNGRRQKSSEKFMETKDSATTFAGYGLNDFEMGIKTLTIWTTNPEAEDQALWTTKSCVYSLKWTQRRPCVSWPKFCKNLSRWFGPIFKIWDLWVFCICFVILQGGAKKSRILTFLGVIFSKKFYSKNIISRGKKAWKARLWWFWTLEVQTKCFSTGWCTSTQRSPNPRIFTTQHSGIYRQRLVARLFPRS